jgi:hypothetical protein
VNFEVLGSWGSARGNIGRDLRRYQRRNPSHSHARSSAHGHQESSETHAMKEDKGRPLLQRCGRQHPVHTHASWAWLWTFFGLDLQFWFWSTGSMRVWILNVFALMQVCFWFLYRWVGCMVEVLDSLTGLVVCFKGIGIAVAAKSRYGSSFVGPCGRVWVRSRVCVQGGKKNVFLVWDLWRKTLLLGLARA